MGGCTTIVERMLGNVEVLLETEYRDFAEAHSGIADTVIYCGIIDAYFDYKLGVLEHRSLRFEAETVACENWQGNAMVNYPERKVPYVRIIEHKHFECGTQPVSVITCEYPASWEPVDELYYPINDERNNVLYAEYAKLAEQEGGVMFAGFLLR